VELHVDLKVVVNILMSSDKVGIVARWRLVKKIVACYLLEKLKQILGVIMRLYWWFMSIVLLILVSRPSQPMLVSKVNSKNWVFLKEYFTDFFLGHFEMKIVC